MKAVPTPAPQWMSVVLFLAGVCNLAWGAWTCLFPADSFYLAWSQRSEEPLPYRLWQGVGMLVGIYGIGYIIAARDPVRHWPIVFVGLLSKVLAPFGVLYAVVSGEVPPGALTMTYPNDLIWWVPFALILGHASRANEPITPSAPPGA
jgi:small multidrug resistance pump